MFTIDETKDMLDEIVDTLPEPLFRELSGGIIVLPQSKMHPKAVDNDLYILGEYSRSSIGVLIKIYYGSFVRIYRDASRQRYYDNLRRVLVHELRHHNETLAGYKDLILYDEDRIAEYLKRKKEQKARQAEQAKKAEAARNAAAEPEPEAENKSGIKTENESWINPERKTPEQWR